MLDLVHDLGHVQKKNVFLCSHLLPDVERTCEFAIVLHRGRTMLSGRIDELTARGGRRLSIAVDGARDGFAQALAEHGYRVESEDGETMCLRSAGDEDDADEIFALAARSGVRLTAVKPLRSSLEDVFLDGVTREAGA